MSERLLVNDGDWVEPVMTGFQHICCDCGLQHTMDFKIEDGELFFRVFRNKDKTETNRINKNPSYPVIKWVIQNMITTEISDE